MSEGPLSKISPDSKESMQIRLRHLARSVFSNWFAMAANLAVGFFLAPFVVHRLGNLAYGVWILTVSTVAYLGLLDLGLASSVVRYVSKAYATQSHEEASELFSGVLWVRLQISAMVLLIAGTLAVLFPHIFKVPPGLAANARFAVLIIGLASATYMALGVYGSVLSALNRYDLRTYATLTQLIVRVVGVVSVLRAGHGIVALAICELASVLIGSAIVLALARRIYPELRLQLGRPRREVLRKIWSYSFYAFLLTVAIQLIYETDNLVVGAVVSASAVTFYSIGNSLCNYARQLISAMTLAFTPAASGYDAQGESAKLRALYYHGTRATMIISLPIAITFLIRGTTFIALWMGPQYAPTSGPVLAILAVAFMLNAPNSVASSIAWGVGKHKIAAMWIVPEAIANFTLSIFLARWIGIYGVAIGTLIPNLVTSQVMWPRLVRQLVGVTYHEVWREIWGPVYLCAIPFAAASYWVNRILPPQRMSMFLLQTAALLTIFVLTVVTVLGDRYFPKYIPSSARPGGTGR